MKFELIMVTEVSGVHSLRALNVNHQLLLLNENNPNIAARKVLKKASVVAIQTVSPREVDLRVPGNRDEFPFSQAEWSLPS